MVPGLSTIVLLLTLFTDSVLTECSDGCNSCSGSPCIKCKSAYYLSDGSCSPCPGDCIRCNGYDDCTSCKPGKWGSDNQCQFTCNNNCQNKVCQDDTGYCVQCKPGLYSLECQHSCTVCDGDLCDLRKCTHRCKEGYYEYNTETESVCQTCPRDCRYCNDKITCWVCNDGFHLYQFNSNGEVFVHCISCSVGSNCSSYCVIQNCSQCQIQNDDLVCTDCPEGYTYNGKTCIQDTTSCSQECSSYCDDDGICLGDCNAGWTGEKCSVKCSDQCLTCDKRRRDICQQCKGDFYTVNCNTACNPSCTTEEGKQTCRLNDGYCLNGCEHNFWGPVCDQSCFSGCINSLSPICERSNGTCKHGCKIGSSGDKCDMIAATGKATIVSGGTSKTTIASEAATTTQRQIPTQYECKENGDYQNIFIRGFFLEIGVSIAVVAATVASYKLGRWYVTKNLKSCQDSLLRCPHITMRMLFIQLKHEKLLTKQITMRVSAIPGTRVMFTMI